jgi:hypothetical protein
MMVGVRDMAGTNYFYAQGNQTFGPYTSSQLRELAAKGTLRPDDHVMPDSTRKWYPARKVKGLFRDQPEPLPEDSIELESAPEPPAAAAPPPLPSQPAGPLFHYLESGQSRGPVSLADLQKRVAAGKLRGEDMIWQEGTPAWAPARGVSGLFPQAPPPLPVAPPANAGGSGHAGAGGVSPLSLSYGPFPANGLKVQPLIDQVLQAGEMFAYGITGELAGGWTTRTFVAALTSKRLLLIEKKMFSFSGEVAKEWHAFPLSVIRVSYKNHLLSASVTMTIQGGETYTLDKIPKDAASRFDQCFLDLSAGKQPMDEAAEIFIKAYREQFTALIAQGALTEEQVNEMAKAAYKGFREGQQQAVRDAVGEGVKNALK